MHDLGKDLADANAANDGSANSNMKQKSSNISLREGTRNRVPLREGQELQVKDFMHCHVVMLR
jgi:hypothetical protein